MEFFAVAGSPAPPHCGNASATSGSGKVCPSNFERQYQVCCPEGGVDLISYVEIRWLKKLRIGKMTVWFNCWSGSAILTCLHVRKALQESRSALTTICRSVPMQPKANRA